MDVEKFIKLNIAKHTESKSSFAGFNYTSSRNSQLIQEFYKKFTNSMMFCAFIDHCSLPTATEVEKENIIFFDEWFTDMYSNGYPIQRDEKYSQSSNSSQHQSHKSRVQSSNFSGSLTRNSLSVTSNISATRSNEDSNNSDNACLLYSPNFNLKLNDEPDPGDSNSTMETDGTFPSLKLDKFTGWGG